MNYTSILDLPDDKREAALKEMGMTADEFRAYLDGLESQERAIAEDPNYPSGALHYGDDFPAVSVVKPKR